MTACKRTGRRGAWFLPRRSLIALSLALVLTCGRTSIDRVHWQQMSSGEKTLYVRSLLGHEQAAASKGGQPPAHPRPAEEYVRAIDTAYARGDSRDANIVFETMGTPRR
jgi:predicted Fe-S protein YdhL (DUF1289 family)